MFSVVKSRIGKAMFMVLSGLLPFCVFGADPLDLPREEFGKYYERITGTKPAKGLVEFVIDGKISQKGMDAYTIRSKGNGVRIAGSNLRSVLYAVYDLLERRGGCGWFWDGEVVPKKNQ